MKTKFNFIINSIFLLSTITSASVFGSDLSALEKDPVFMRKLYSQYFTEESTDKIMKKIAETEAKTKEEIDAILDEFINSDLKAKAKRNTIVFGSREESVAEAQKGAAALLSSIKKQSILAYQQAQSLFPEITSYNSPTQPEETELQPKPLSKKAISQKVLAIEQAENQERLAITQSRNKTLSEIKKPYLKFKENKEKLILLEDTEKLIRAKLEAQLRELNDQFLKDMQQRAAAEKNKIKQKPSKVQMTTKNNPVNISICTDLHPAEKSGDQINQICTDPDPAEESGDQMNQKDKLDWY